MPGKVGFTLIELLVVIAIIAILTAIIMPALSTAKKITTGAVCVGNQRSRLTGWIMYADDSDGLLINNRACYETADDRTPWVHRPKDTAGNALSYDPLASYHNKSSTFGFADGHADRQTWRDKRTLEALRENADNPASHSGMYLNSPGNEDIKWLIEHFIARDRLEGGEDMARPFWRSTALHERFVFSAILV